MAFLTPTSYYEHLLNDVSAQMASSALSQRQLKATPPRFSGQGRSIARIEKPRSAHNSPRGVVDRRRTTAGIKHYATLDDHYRMMFGLDNTVEETRPSAPIQTRPMSWHPVSSRGYDISPGHMSNSPITPLDIASIQTTPDFHQPYPSYFPPSAVPLNSPPRSHPVAYSANYGQDTGLPLPQSNMPYQPMPEMNLNNYPGPLGPTAIMPSYIQNLPNHSNAWSQPAPHPSNSTSHDLHKSTSEPSETPSTHTGKPPLRRQKSDELIGLGLYDPPKYNHSWILSGSPVTGEGLKLEETWQPPESSDEADDADDDDADDDESSEDEDEVEEPPNLPDHPVRGQGFEHSMQWQAVPSVQAPQWAPPPTTLRPTPTMNMDVNLAGQSFLFPDEEEPLKNEFWWSQQQQHQHQQAGKQMQMQMQVEGFRQAQGTRLYGWS
ncbi:hypothetical protein K402DRAFT_243112 [Aulographum hederae CBS 113979]|uniref:Uncharacterized protein n=1 Tax=Aulographum hederae CBS 113979 TaxID=1176131 RepID=A0A6G1HA29_9PEZI|nr:hypothetical protein K402DRAFT_243112 [Aulographum hederae CBS 113979]